VGKNQAGVINMKKLPLIKEFALKHRRLANTFWLWGLIYPLLLILIIGLIYLINPFLPYWFQLTIITSFQLLLLIEVFFSLFLTYRVFKSKFKGLLTCIFQFLLQLIICLVFLSIFLFIMKFSSSDYIENTANQKEDAPIFFSETTNLDYPYDAKLINVSHYKLTRDESVNMIFSVNDVDSFIENASKLYRFEPITMDFPWIKSSSVTGNFLVVPLCMKGINTVKVKPTAYFLITKIAAEIENFCGRREVLFTQIIESRHQPIIMVILPKEKLVWLNHSFYF